MAPYIPIRRVRREIKYLAFFIFEKVGTRAALTIAADERYALMIPKDRERVELSGGRADLDRKVPMSKIRSRSSECYRRKWIKGT